MVRRGVPARSSRAFRRVVDVGWQLVAIPSQRRDLELGSRVEARLERASPELGRGSQMSWQVSDRQRERDQGRGR